MSVMPNGELRWVAQPPYVDLELAGG